MRRALLPLLGLGCGLVLLLFVYRAVLLQGEQFAFRDAAHFYYPLYLRVQQEWSAGRWPLWDPGQNGGQPLLGSPMAAALYPGKLLYTALPYAWAARLYVVAHSALACLGMYLLARSLGISRAGANLAALSYGFGAPVLSLYGNVIFLVGAAWLPFGLRAVDGLVRQGRGSAVLELAVVLTMQVLGGDPQAAFLTVISGAGYAVVVRYQTVRESEGEGERPARPRSWWLAIALAGFVAWVLITLVCAQRRRSLGGWLGPIWIPAVLIWGAAAAWILWRRYRPEDRRPLDQRLVRLAGAAGLALALSAAQIVPTAEFTASSNRTGEVNALTYSKFSTEPYRLAECLWPTVFGLRFPENRTWSQVIPPRNDRQLWQPSLYVGGLALLLGLGAAGFRGGPPWRTWFTVIAVIGLLAGFGRFGSPLWWARWLPGAEAAIGPHDPLFSQPRTDGFLEDGTGSVYSLLAAVLPGFGLFRYPSKLLTLSAAALAVLAGAGWDRAMADRDRRLVRRCAAALGASALALAIALAFGGRIVAALAGRIAGDALSGPPDAAGAWAETQRALAHGLLISAVALGLATWGPRRPRLATIIALLVMTADLGIANARLVWTAPQSAFATLPALAARIASAERSEPTTGSGPSRIHRMPLWHPDRFRVERSPERSRELTEWERSTLQGLHALPLGLEESLSAGFLELDEYLLLFRPRIVPAQGEVARALNIRPGAPVFYSPRRCFDLWGARYFILPVEAKGWGTDARGYASFVPNTEIIAPEPGKLGDSGGRQRWAEQEDWQLLRNKAAYPRAWVVHQVRVRPPATDLESRAKLVDEIAYQNDPFWSEPGRRVYDPRIMAWIETDDPRSLRGYVSPPGTSPSQSSVTVIRSEPLRVELQANLDRPGLVILADTYYPGWRLTIDGHPAPILRANRMMRGAAVRAGDHLLAYTYDPWSFRIGLVISLTGLATLLALSAKQVWQSPKGLRATA